MISCTVWPTEFWAISFTSQLLSQTWINHLFADSRETELPDFQGDRNTEGRLFPSVESHLLRPAPPLPSVQLLWCWWFPCWVVSTSWDPIVARQAPLCRGLFRQEYWSGLPFPSLGDLLNPGTEPTSSALQADSLPRSHLGSHSSCSYELLSYRVKVMHSPCGTYLLRYYFRHLGETKVNTGTKPHFRKASWTW